MKISNSVLRIDAIWENFGTKIQINDRNVNIDSFSNSLR